MRAYRPGDSVGELTPWPFENPASDYVILRGSPQASGRIDRGGASGDATRLGIWACTEGAFECTELGNELQTILTGRLRLTGPALCLAIWGIAYKPGTHSTVNAPSLALLRGGVSGRLNIYEPSADLGVIPHDRWCRAATPEAALDGADALVILTPLDSLKQVAPATIAAALRRPIVIDPFALLDGEACRQAGLYQHRLGIATTPTEEDRHAAS